MPCPQLCRGQMGSGGTVFCKALAKALVQRNANSMADVQAIKSFINTKTGFRCTNILVKDETEIVIKAVANSDPPTVSSME